MTPATDELLRLARESLESSNVLSTGRDGALSTEDYARLAEVNADFEEEMFTHLSEMTPQQVCALFDLARAGLDVAALLAERDRLRRLLIAESVALWHSVDGVSDNCELHEYLGMTQDEYAAWLERSELPSGWPKEDP